jgi:hypothetical protein
MASPASSLSATDDVQRAEGMVSDELLDSRVLERILRYVRCYRVALITYGLFLPYLIAVITIMALVQPAGVSFAPDWIASRVWLPENAVFAGLFGAIVIWLVVSLFLTRIATPEGANWHSYADLNAHLDMLQAAQPVHCANCTWVSARVTCGTIASHMKHAKKHLQEPGLHWVTGHGYSHLWRILQRADDDLIAVEPKEDVVRRALTARLRLIGSDMPHWKYHVKRLDTAIIALCPSMESLLDEYSDTGLDEPVESRPVTASDISTSQPDSNPESPSEQMAREKIRVAQRVIREYRDAQWSGLLEGRNRLWTTTFATEVGAVALLGLAVVTATPDQREAVSAGVVGAATFFLIGGVVGGLYSRLRSAMEAETAAEDYGLSTARLFATPLFSGLAAVGGVILTEAVTHLAQPTIQTVGVGQMLEITPLHLVMAALFGLVPARFFDRLGQAEDRVANLRRTEPLGSGKGVFENNPVANSVRGPS